MQSFQLTHRCSQHPQVKLVFSGHNKALNTTRFLCPLCGTVREYSTGVVKHVLNERGFFFIDNGSERDVFAHMRNLATTFFPNPGQAVEFEVQSSPKGPQALAIRLLDTGRSSQRYNR